MTNLAIAVTLMAGMIFLTFALAWAANDGTE